jgi:hypothetical protein
MIAFLFICVMPAVLLLAGLPLALIGLMLETSVNRGAPSGAGTCAEPVTVFTGTLSSVQ